MDTRASECRRGIDRADMPVRYRAAQDRGMQQTGTGQIADISAAAAEKSPILEAFDGAADIPVRYYRGLLYTARATSPII
jgi:hypothetical protein